MFKRIRDALTRRDKTPPRKIDPRIPRTEAEAKELARSLRARLEAESKQDAKPKG